MSDAADSEEQADAPDRLKKKIGSPPESVGETVQS
jgi:hypothetical protein